jgi:hypothetical protein
MSQQNSNDARKSKLVFFAIIAVILGGTAFWYALTVWAAEPVGPHIAKEFAKDFEHECFLELHEEEQCKKLIGQNHSECIFANIERVDEGAGDDGGSLVHDREGYMECMREATGVRF